MDQTSVYQTFKRADIIIFN